MSDRHMHITSRLYDGPGGERLILAAQELGFFREVLPLRSGNGKLIAVAFLSRDLDGISDEIEMPGTAAALAGIVEHGIEIVSAWDGPRPGRRRECVFYVPGRQELAGQEGG